MDGNRNLCSSQETIEQAFIHYYHDLFTSTRPQNVDQCTQAISSSVTMVMNHRLVADFIVTEINLALSQMPPFKAPGPDGFTTDFYQQNWETVQDEVCSDLPLFLNYGQMDDHINTTNIALIPKLKESVNVSDFQPISLCNVIYKLAAKVLANRLKEFFPVIISPQQSASIPGRLITDNVLTAFEILHSMHTRMWSRVGFMGLKLDMNKFYDRVEWVFLDVFMCKMGFANRWINLVMTCVRSVSYAIVINGRTVGDIKPRRGLRQGDPLSPYLFLICAEALSSLLQQAEQRGSITGVPMSKHGPSVSHFFFCK